MGPVDSVSLRRLALALARDEHAADDLVQDAWVAALERPGGARGVRRGWLAVAVRHLAFNRRAVERRRREREERVARPEATGDEDVARRVEVQARVVEALRRLPEELRTAIWLRYFDELGPREIAARTGAPVATVKSRLARAKQLLRDDLDRSFGGQRAEWLGAFMPVLARRDAPAQIAGRSSLMNFAVQSSIVLAAGVAALIVWSPDRRGAPAGGERGEVAAVVPAEASTAPTPIAPRGPAERASGARAAAAGAPTVTAPEVDSSLATLAVTARYVGGDALPDGTCICAYPRERGTEHQRVVALDRRGTARFADLEPGRWVLYSELGGRELVELRAGSEASIALAVPEGTMVAGVVVDADGVPVEGALVRAHSSLASRSSVVLARTGSDGRFPRTRLGSVQTLFAEHARHAPSPYVRLTCHAGDLDDVRFVLGRAEAIARGVAKDERGAPLAGVHVELAAHFEGGPTACDLPPTAQKATTDAAGRFALALPAGPLRLRASHDVLFAPELGLELAPGEVRDVELRFTRGAFVRGSLLGPDGEPLATGSVVALDRAGRRADARVGSEGTYRVGPVLAGLVELVATSREHGKARAELELAPGEEGAWSPRFGRVAPLEGRLLAADGTPAAGHVLYLHDRSVGSKRSSLRVDTDADGRFAFPPVPAGRWTLTAGRIDVPFTLLCETVWSGEGPLALRIDARALPTTVVVGCVRYADGRVAADVEGRIGAVGAEMPSSTQGFALLTGADGCFRSEILPPGRHELRIRPEDAPERVLDLEVGGEPTLDLGTIFLDPAAKLVVRLTTLRPAGDEVSVRILAPNGQAGGAIVQMTSAEHDVVRILPPGRYTVVVQRGRAAGALEPRYEVRLEPGDELLLAIDVDALPDAQR